MRAHPVPLVTEAEFLRLEESKDKVELIDGEIYVSPAPSRRHQRLVMALAAALHAWARSQSPPWEVLPSPVDVRFAPDRILQPDIAVFDRRLDPNEEGPIAQIPVLCVEVLSRDRVHDRVTKRHIYALAGVAEYWTVDPAGVVERWIGEAFQERLVVETEITTSRLPGFSLSLGTLFA